jgi:hypothetical protein
MPEKTIHNWLIINWQDGSTRTRKSEPSPSSLGTHELATELRLDVVIPEVDVDELRARVEVPKPRVEQTALDDMDADDAPDWMDVADDRLAEFFDRAGYDWSAWREAKAAVVVDILDNAPTRPPVADVKTYANRQVKQTIRDHQDQGAQADV